MGPILGVKLPARLIGAAIGAPGRPPGDGGEFGPKLGKLLRVTPGVKKQIDDKGSFLLRRDASLLGGAAGRDGPSGIHREKCSDSWNQNHTTVGNNPWIDRTVALFEMNSG